MNMEHWSSVTDRGNESAVRGTCFSATLSTTNLTWTGLG